MPVAPSLETVHLADLLTFTEVASALSVTGAALALGVPKSAVSKALTRLEAALGVRLIERTSRRMALTKAGAALVPRAAALLTGADELTRSMRDERSAQRGLSADDRDRNDRERVRPRAR